MFCIREHSFGLISWTVTGQRETPLSREGSLLLFAEEHGGVEHKELRIRLALNSVPSLRVSQPGAPLHFPAEDVMVGGGVVALMSSPVQKTLTKLSTTWGRLPLGKGCQSCRLPPPAGG